MRNMSFALTTRQFLDRSKTVTRRMKWLNLKAGDELMGVQKCQGLKPGEKIKRLGALRVLSVRREQLDEIDMYECRREGFAELGPSEFVEMFCEQMKCEPSSIVTRIEFYRIGGAA